MNVRIRAAIDGDEDRLTFLNSFVQDLHVGQRPDFFKPPDPDEVVESFRTLLNDSSARIWIAEESGVAIGCPKPTAGAA